MFLTPSTRTDPYVTWVRLSNAKRCAHLVSYAFKRMKEENSLLVSQLSPLPTGSSWSFFRSLVTEYCQQYFFHVCIYNSFIHIWISHICNIYIHNTFPEYCLKGSIWWDDTGDYNNDWNSFIATELLKWLPIVVIFNWFLPVKFQGWMQFQNQIQNISEVYGCMNILQLIFNFCENWNETNIYMKYTFT